MKVGIDKKRLKRVQIQNLVLSLIFVIFIAYFFIDVLIYVLFFYLVFNYLYSKIYSIEYDDKYFYLENLYHHKCIEVKDFVETKNSFWTFVHYKIVFVNQSFFFQPEDNILFKIFFSYSTGNYLKDLTQEIKINIEKIKSENE